MKEKIKQKRQVLSAKFNAAASRVSKNAHKACYGPYGALARPVYNFSSFAADDLRKSREQNIVYGILLCVPGGWFALSVIFATKYFAHRVINKNPAVITKAHVKAFKENLKSAVKPKKNEHGETANQNDAPTPVVKQPRIK